MRFRSDGFPQIPRILYPLPRPRSLNYWNMQHVTSQSPLGECTFTTHSFFITGNTYTEKSNKHNHNSETDWSGKPWAENHLAYSCNKWHWRASST